MAVDMSYLHADRDYYEPPGTADPGAHFQVGPLPAGWTRLEAGPWTHWSRPDLELPDQGWKVHVASSLTNARAVLPVVSAACADLGVPFKHLTGRGTFLLMHDKHAARVQSGKFCTLYPASEQAALQMLQRLETDLAGISGPFVLTDRRFGGSECVSYRYGAFRGRDRIDAEGYPVPIMTGPAGEQLDDQRRPEFWLPDGMADPFRPPAAAPAAAPGPVTLHGYTFEKVVQHSNAGGAYQFRAEHDEPVFIKEARAHNGYTADGADAATRLTAEYLTLRAIHGRDASLCPRPVELFHHWEQAYLVTERVPGSSLYRWMVTNNPALRANAERADFVEYYRRSLALLDQLQDQLDRLHALGYVFIDLSPTNALVDDDDQLRLIDFEAAQPIGDVRQVMGTPGFQHPDPQSVAKDDPRELDRFGLAALALLLLLPVAEVVNRHPPVLDHLHANLAELAPTPSRLWQWATSYHDRSQDSPLPTPQAVRDDPVTELRWLADQTADALQAMARPDHPSAVYPTVPMGHQTNTRALAAGTAGVLHALRRAGRECDPAIIRRLRDDSLAAAQRTVPGLLYGSAGIANVLAESGETDAAGALLEVAAEHPLNDISATLGGGSAGTAIGLMSHYLRTGEQRWLDAADRLLSKVPDGPELTGQLSRTYESGLVGGRSGVALALYHLHRLTGDPRPFARGLRMLGDELAYAEPIRADGLGFKPSHTDRRVFPYLAAGSAGYAAVLSRYLAYQPDAEFTGAELSAAETLERCLRAASVRFCAFPGLFLGLAGLVGSLAGAGRRLGRPELVDAAFASARGLFRYALPHKGGIGWLGDPGQRLSAELWSGSAGVLIALHELIEPAPGLLDTLDVPLRVSRVVVTSTVSERRNRDGRSSAFAG